MSLATTTELAVTCAGLFSLVAMVIRWRREYDAFLLFVALGPPAIGVALLPLTGHLNLSRYLAYSAPLLILAAARGLSLLRLPTSVSAAALLVAALVPATALPAYYRSVLKDYDAAPLVRYLRTAAKRSDGAQDVIFVAPNYVTRLLSYESRDALSWQGLDDVAEVRRAIGDAVAANRPVWLVVERQRPEYLLLAAETELGEEAVPGDSGYRLKLFRSRAR